MALDLFFFSGFSLYPSLSFSLSPLSISLFPKRCRRCVRWVAVVVVVEVERGGEEGRGHLQRSLNVTRSLVRNLWQKQQRLKVWASFCSVWLIGELLCGDPLWHLDLIHICIEKKFSQAAQLAFIFNGFSAETHVPPSFDKNMNVTEQQIKMKGRQQLWFIIFFAGLCLFKQPYLY